MAHETPLSTIVFQKTDGSTGELAVHDSDALHNETGSVSTDNIATGAVHTEDIAGQAVTSDKLANNAVTTTTINNKAVTKAKLADEVTTEIQGIKDSISQVTSKDVKSSITAGPAFTVIQATLYQYGPLKRLFINIKNSAALTVDTPYLIFSCTGDVKPTFQSMIGSCNFTGDLSSAGNCNVIPARGIPANSDIYMTSVWYL